MRWFVQQKYFVALLIANSELSVCQMSQTYNIGIYQISSIPCSGDAWYVHVTSWVPWQTSYSISSQALTVICTALFLYTLFRHFMITTTFLIQIPHECSLNNSVLVFSVTSFIMILAKTILVFEILAYLFMPICRCHSAWDWTNRLSI